MLKQNIFSRDNIACIYIYCLNKAMIFQLFLFIVKTLTFTMFRFLLIILWVTLASWLKAIFVLSKILVKIFGRISSFFPVQHHHRTWGKLSRKSYLIEKDCRKFWRGNFQCHYPQDQYHRHHHHQHSYHKWFTDHMIWNMPINVLLIFYRVATLL